MKIAFRGTRLMGSGFVRRLRADGRDDSVWNRTAAKARVLEVDRVRAFAPIRPLRSLRSHAAEARSRSRRRRASRADLLAMLSMQDRLRVRVAAR